MDIVRTTKKSMVTKYRWFFIAAFSLLVIYFFNQAVVGSDFTSERSKLLLATVERGEFTIKVRGPGILTPKEFRWIASDVEGRAERVLVKPGAHVKAGDLLIELTNPQLERKLEETRWELEAQEAETQASLVDLESQLLDQKAKVFNAKLNFETVAMRLRAETELFVNGAQAVSKLDYERTKLQNTQTQERWNIEKQREIKMKESVIANQNALNARLNKMRKTLQSMEEQVANLQVRATIDSVVQDVAIEAGQQVIMGSNLAKLAQQNELIAELQIPELAIRDVALGQSVMIDTRNNHIAGTVIRIAPSVNNSAVQVDVSLTEPLPSDARPDLSIDGEILVAQLNDTLFVRRPSFAQSNRSVKLFKLDTTGDSAKKVAVEFGRGSVQKIQIKNGLSVGDQIIISQSEEIQRFNTISIN
ncbi:MAG: HlyD family secretion protein [Colwellia sp.]|jgi:HlyD family secretion protein